MNSDPNEIDSDPNDLDPPLVAGQIVKIKGDFDNIGIRPSEEARVVGIRFETQNLVPPDYIIEYRWAALVEWPLVEPKNNQWIAAEFLVPARKWRSIDDV